MIFGLNCKLTKSHSCQHFAHWAGEDLLGGKKVGWKPWVRLGGREHSQAKRMMNMWLSTGGELTSYTFTADHSSQHYLPSARPRLLTHFSLLMYLVSHVVPEFLNLYLERRAAGWERANTKQEQKKQIVQKPARKDERENPSLFYHH